jgi:DnaK suppressor protein
MFVSILQRFGLRGLLRSGEPLQSRADQNTRTAESGGPARSIAEGHPEATSQRRQVVKAQAKTPGKPKESEKPPHAAKATAKTPVKQKMPIKTAVKPIAKAAKPVAVVKAAAKESAKPVVRAAVTQKLVVKKAMVKVASRAVPEVVAKPVALKGKVASKTTKLAHTPVAVKPARLLAVAKASPAAVAGKKAAIPAMAPAPQPAPHPIERSKPMTSPPALKPGRRSSARAPSQLPPPAPMVPTHAPDAAKASYSIMTERVMAPPPHVAAKKDPKLANNWKTKPANELTDDEVKAMPDAEYMNDKQMAFFRHKLSVLKQEIHNSAGETTEHLREETVVVPDPADRATIEEEHALELRTRDRERKLLKKIEQSIGRIDSGDYGYCDETGEPIGVGRLIARPTANLSLEAQQRRELKQKMFGD